MTEVATPSQLKLEEPPVIKEFPVLTRWLKKLRGSMNEAQDRIKVIKTDHGQLFGLTDDDHTQYLLANGSRALTANWDAGSFNIRAETFTSDLADGGAAPLTVTSTALVTNLNAEHWNSKHLGTVANGKLVRYNSTGTQFETGTVTESSGALGAITTISMSNQLTNTLADGTAPMVITSGTKVSNLNVDKVDGVNIGSLTDGYLVKYSSTGTQLVNATNTDAELASAVSGTHARQHALDSALDHTGTLTVALGGTGAGTFTDGGLLCGATTGAIEALAVGLTTQILVGGGAATNPSWGTDLPTGVTIGTGYIYRGGGTDVAVVDGGTGTSTGSITGTGTLTFTSGGSNTNVALVPNGIGKATITGYGEFTGTVINAAVADVITINATMADLTDSAGLRVNLTTHASTSNTQSGIACVVDSTYTGSKGIFGIYSTVASKSTGTVFTACNLGYYLYVNGTGNGTNIGGLYMATGGLVNIGTVGTSFLNKNSGKNVGMMGLAINGGTSPLMFGGIFMLHSHTGMTSHWPATSAALVCDNAEQAVDIFIARDNATTVFTIADGGDVGIGVTPTAYLHIKAGTATAGDAPLKFNSGTLLGTPEAGAVEFVTDDWYATITTGAARKKFVLDNGTDLVSGRIPYATTNGRLNDSTGLTYDGSIFKTKDIQPITDDTYYLGKNSISTPLAYKAIILKDTALAKYWRVEVISGALQANEIT